MCSTCGCGHGEVTIDGKPAEAHGDGWHQHEDGTWHSHEHAHRHDHAHAHEGGRQHGHEHGHRHDHPHHHDDGHHHHGRHHHHGHGHSHDHHHHSHGHAHEHMDERAHEQDVRGPLGAVHREGMAASRIVAVERDILERNDAVAAQNRQLFADRGLFALNLVSSPGSGKTTLLVRTIEMLGKAVACAVIEGDQQTQNDAERVRATGVAAVQINTGKGCHLDARMVAQAMTRLPATEEALLFIENVGNLVCPAAFDLGEAHKVAILSVTEGTDKPLKYPDMFHAADLLLINKIDLLPHVDFDVEQAIDHARRIRPELQVLQVSATTGAGMPAWLDWLKAGLAAVQRSRADDVAALRRKIAALEAQLAARG